mmetsp:Transcript_24922/g.50014  ORF Transcript_24922/g.50014 Transcript_24922/m.50014 type:complete len:84 (+) Transcript_24922:199-450(+)
MHQTGGPYVLATSAHWDKSCTAMPTGEKVMSPLTETTVDSAIHTTTITRSLDGLCRPKAQEAANTATMLPSFMNCKNAALQYM